MMTKRPYDLTVSEKLRSLEQLVLNATSVKDVDSVIITHVLSTSENYLDLVHRVFPIQLVIAIPYSADKQTLENLNSKGIRVYLPSSIEDAFSNAGRLVEEILLQSTRPLVVQEVGGYLAGYTSQLSKYPHFKGIVEDTENGNWRYKSMGSHSCPILSMAKSPIKDIEDTVIGDSVIFSTERIFRENFHAVLQGCRSGVIGYGKIGSSTAIALRGRESHVSVYDLDPTKAIRAKYEGFSISPLHQLLATSDLVVGCTGQTSVQREDIPYIKRNAILVSASAKDEEFNLKTFEEECQLEKLSSIVWRYTKSDDSCFYLLNQGTPINFRDRSILGNILDLIYSELFVCMHAVAEGKIPPGLHPSGSEIHATVSKAWLSVYEELFLNDSEDKIWNYPENLILAYPKTYYLQALQKKEAQLLDSFKVEKEPI